MTAALLERRFVADYARTGTNLLLLGLVPVTFVIVAAPTLADAAMVLGGAGGGLGIETVTAGWAAAFLTGIAMYFQVASSRATDRRLVARRMGFGEARRRRHHRPYPRGCERRIHRAAARRRWLRSGRRPAPDGRGAAGHPRRPAQARISLHDAPGLTGANVG